jgi:hypothetical protein
MEKYQIVNELRYRDPASNTVKIIPIDTIVTAEKATPTNTAGVSDEFSFPPASFAGKDLYVINVPNSTQKILANAYFIYPYLDAEVDGTRPNYLPWLIGAALVALIAFGKKKKVVRRKR